MQQYVFALTALAMAVGAVRVVTTKNLVHGALWLVVVLGGMAIAFVLLTAELLAWVQVLIYVGAVIVLLLFGLMLTRAPIGKGTLDNQQRGLAALVAGGIFAITSSVLYRAFEGQNIRLRPQAFSTEALGEEIFTRFVLPFEIVSVLLLAAMIGAVILAKRD